MQAGESARRRRVLQGTTASSIALLPPAQPWGDVAYTSALALWRESGLWFGDLPLGTSVLPASVHSLVPLSCLLVWQGDW